MKPVTLILCALSLLAGASCRTMKSRQSTAPGAISPAQLTWRVSQTVTLPYLLYLPPDYAPDSGRRWPLLLFLHGAGERGTNLQKVAVHGPLRQVREGESFPFVIVAPLCPARQTWNAEHLLRLLDHAEQTYAVDPARVYVTGLSMGGYGTWDLVVRYPERFAAAVPICGGGSLISVLLARNYETNRMAELRRVGLWVFHGARDTAVPLEESERMVRALEAAGCKRVQFTVYPEAGHDSWTETYRNPELYRWLLQHRRQRRKPSRR